MCSAEGFVAASVVTQAFGKYEEAKGQYNYYNALAKTNDEQAGLVERTGEQNVNAVQDQAARDAKVVFDDGRRVEGSQKAALAANGVGGGSVTAEDLARETFSQNTADEMAVRHTADMKSWEIRNQAKFQAWDLRNQGRMHRMAAKNASKAGAIGIGGSLLGGAGQFYGSKG